MKIFSNKQTIAKSVIPNIERIVKWDEFENIELNLFDVSIDIEGKGRDSKILYGDTTEILSLFLTYDNSKKVFTVKNKKFNNEVIKK